MAIRRTQDANATLSRRGLLKAAGAGGALAALGIAGCGESGPVGGARSLVATTGMVADAVNVVLGTTKEQFSLHALMGAGVDPHSYRETRADVESLLGAEAVFWNGLYLEAQLEELLLKLGAEKTVVALGEAVPIEQRRANEDYEGRYDPHVWMDPVLWALAVASAKDALSALQPARAEAYAENFEAYRAALVGLNAYAGEVLASVPEEQRVLITAHDAFGYFGAAYGFEVVGVQGLSTESEAGLARIRELVDLIVSRGVRAVFVESSVSARNVEALIEGAAARGADVSVGGELFSDAMGRPGTYEGSYLGMIDHNVTAIARSLGGEAPERGWKGKLGA